MDNEKVTASVDNKGDSCTNFISDSFKNYLKNILKRKMDKSSVSYFQFIVIINFLNLFLRVSYDKLL